MNRYILLRIISEPSKEPAVPDEIVVKFFPVKDKLNRPIILQAVTPEDALALVRISSPHLIHFFAVEPEERYLATVRRLTELSAKRRGGNSGGKSSRAERPIEDAQPRPQVADTVG